MPRYIIKKPNGKLAIWSTIVDDFIMMDITKEEYISFKIKEAEVEIRKEIEEVMVRIERGEYNSYSWDEAMNYLREKEKFGEEKK